MMMESGSLDFDDLVDTGDEYPGFEIAKFQPANKTDADGDRDLHTPDADLAGDAEDSIAGPSEANGNGEETKLSTATDDVKSDDANPSLSFLGLQSKEGNEKKSEEEVKPSLAFLGLQSTTGDQEKSEEEGKAEASTKTEGNTVQADETSGGGDGSESEITMETAVTEQQDTPKKKQYLLPPKPKMKLWDRKKSADNTDENDLSEGGEETTDATNGEGGGSGLPEEEEDPHQQSFLSFFNLQPGMSKPNDEQKRKKEAEENDFYARKRLRTRKKVSYVEDVKDESDEEDYVQEEEEEDMNDHRLTVQKSRGKALTTGRSPNKSMAALNYAQALQNLSPQMGMRPRMPTVTPPRPLTPIAPAVSPRFQNMPNLVTDLTSPGGNIKGLFECGLCGTFFNTAGQFIAHQEQMHKEENKNGRSGMETFRCEICQFVLTNRFAYLEHKRMKHTKSQVSFSCNKCAKAFTYLVDLQKHKENCGMQAPVCGVCNMKFATMQQFITHRNKMHASQTNHRPWLNCVNKSCSFKCLTQHEMKVHIQNKHMINELFPCNAPRCARIFSTRDQLNEHKKEAHASEFIVQYQCMECKVCYSSKTLLAEHQYLHTMDKLKKCDICQRQFGTLGQLKKHKEVHACKGTFQCTACTRWCIDRQELVSHVCQERRLKLPGPRIYFCDICLKDFKTDEMMFVHRKDHKKYYQCGTCLWECDTEADYFEHRELHGIFTCEECCEEMGSEDELVMHVKAHKYYIKVQEEVEENSKRRVMYLCPNFMNMIKS